MLILLYAVLFIGSVVDIDCGTLSVVVVVDCAGLQTEGRVHHYSDATSYHGH